MSRPGAPYEELLRLFVAVSDGSIGVDDFAKLDALLADDPEARALYIEFTRTSAMLEQRAASRAEHDADDTQADGLVLAGLEADSTSIRDAEQWLAPPSAGASLVDRTDELARRVREQKEADRRKLRAMERQRGHGAPSQNNPLVIPKAVLWLGAAAAAVLIGVLVVLNLPEPPANNIAEIPTPRDGTTAPAPVATLTYTDQAIWSGPRGRLFLNSRVAPGQVRLESGVAHFVLDSGAVVMVQGPATLDLTSAWDMALESGLIVAHVPEMATGFQVACDGLTITDLGTEFAVRADPVGVQCRVILGEVQLAVPDAGGTGTTTQRLRENRLVLFDRAAGTVAELDYREADDIAWALPYAAVLNQELVVNGGFEDGAIGDAHSPTQVDNVAIPGWDNDGEASVLGYEQAGVQTDVGFPDYRSDPVPDDRGEAYYFARYPGTMTQSVDLSAAAALTDAGETRFVFSADLGGYITQNDRALTAVVFLDAEGQELSRADLEPVDAAARGNRTGFIHRSISDALPAGTRSARIEVTGVRHIGGFCDGFADNISLVIEADTNNAQSSSQAPRPLPHNTVPPPSAAWSQGGGHFSQTGLFWGASCDALPGFFS